MATNPACVIGDYCSRHNFIHGAEAEELREKLTALVDELDDEAADSYRRSRERDAKREVAARLRALLDDVDARDAVAWLEHRTDETE